MDVRGCDGCNDRTHMPSCICMQIWTNCLCTNAQVTEETGFLQELNGTLEDNHVQLERQIQVTCCESVVVLREPCVCVVARPFRPRTHPIAATHTQSPQQEAEGELTALAAEREERVPALERQVQELMARLDSASSSSSSGVEEAKKEGGAALTMEGAGPPPAEGKLSGT